MAGMELEDQAAAQIAREELLRIEIAFWKQLIGSVDNGKRSCEYIERMQQALVLAEYRLDCLAHGKRAGDDPGAWISPALRAH
jgi:hypothetical protein